MGRFVHLNGVFAYGDYIAVLQGASLHALTIHKGSIQTVEILDHQMALLRFDLGVVAGNRQIIDGDGIVRTSSDRYAATICGNFLQDRAFKLHDEHGHFLSPLKRDSYYTRG